MKPIFALLVLLTLTSFGQAAKAAEEKETVLVAVRDKSGKMIHIEVLEKIAAGSFNAPEEGSEITAANRKDRPDIPKAGVAYGNTVRVPSGKCYITAMVRWKGLGIAEKIAGYAPLSRADYDRKLKILGENERILKHGCL